MSAESNQCHICASPLRPLYPRVRDPQTGETFGISQCVSCGLGHTNPQPVDLVRYYGPRYHGGRHGFTEQLCVNRRLRFVRAVAQPKTILDFGCGDGAFLAVASELGWDAMGVETHPWHARERGLVVTERIEEATGPFDAITMWHSLEHVRSPRQLMQAITARLNVEGTVLVAVPNLDSLQARTFKQHWFHLDVPRHLFHFTPTSLTRLLKASGLRIVRRWNLESEQDLFGWTQGILNRIISQPNVLFDVLTARGGSHKRWEVGTSLILGAGVTLASADSPARRRTFEGGRDGSRRQTIALDMKSPPPDRPGRQAIDRVANGRPLCGYANPCLFTATTNLTEEAELIRS